MAGEAQSKCILVCEDDPAMIRIFQFLLRQQGIRHVLTTSAGQQVKTMVETNKPDLILLDLMLPDKDGLSVLKELKENEKTRLIPVIVVSGKEAQDQVRQAMMAGAIDYVIKPFEPMELGNRIKNFLETLSASSGGDAAAGYGA
ncbi:MAG TPA: response regulator [Elusimicrobiota bacterium]|nr:response regulator [Elusimicrobiota bacterium]